MSNWTEKDLNNLKNKGLKTNDIEVKGAKVIKPVKISIEKITIRAVLQNLKLKGFINDFVEEHRFHDVRRFRFDWAILDHKIAIEYEGIFSAKSRHTTKSGYTGDIEKYNLALTEGWKVLRYTAANYLNITNDLLKLLNATQEQIQERENYCRLFSNGAIDDKCKNQCKSCIISTPDDLLSTNFIL